MTTQTFSNYFLEGEVRTSEVLLSLHGKLWPGDVLMISAGQVSRCQDQDLESLMDYQHFSQDWT